MYQTTLDLPIISDPISLESFVILESDPRWQETVEQFQKTKIFSLDIETFSNNNVDKNGGLEALNPWKGEIRTIQIAFDGKVLVLDLGERDNRKPLNHEFLALLSQQLRDQNCLKVGMNFKFDLLYLMVKFGIQARNVVDIMLLSQLQWAGLERSHNLAAICERLGLEVDKAEQKSDFGLPLTNAQLNYGARDALVTLEAFHRLFDLVTKSKLLESAKAESLSLPGFVEMEFYGMPIDRSLLLSTLEQYESTAVKVLSPFKARFPEINHESPKQVVNALNQEFGLMLASSSAEALASYWYIPEIEALSFYRTLRTNCDYIRNCLRVADYYGDNAVRTTYRQSAPKGFGRSTSGEDKIKSKIVRPGVNLQNPPGGLPKQLWKYNLPKLRDFFRTPDDQKLLVADLSQAHLRIATEASQDRTLLKVYLEGADSHCLTAATLAQKQGLGSDWTADNINLWRSTKDHPNAKQAKALRDLAKPVMYGSLNVQGGHTLKTTAEKDGVVMTLEEAKLAIKAWRETYKDLYNFQWRIVKDANNRPLLYKGRWYGEVRGLSNRRLYLEKYKSDFYPDNPPSVKMNDACAFYWTSTEADAMKHAIGLFIQKRDQHPEWEAKLRNIVHDELDVSCKAEYADTVANILQKAMRKGMERYIKTIPVDENTPAYKLIVNSWADK